MPDSTARSFLGQKNFPLWIPGKAVLIKDVLADYFSVKESPAAASGSSIYTLLNT